MQNYRKKLMYFCKLFLIQHSHSNMLEYSLKDEIKILFNDNEMVLSILYRGQIIIQLYYNKTKNKRTFGSSGIVGNELFSIPCNDDNILKQVCKILDATNFVEY